MKYEDYDNIKIYWVDGYHGLRYANIMNVGSNSAELYNHIPNVNLYEPTFIEKTSGTIKAGKVQYFYTLLKSKGVRSKLSPASSMIFINSTSPGSSSNKGQSSSAISNMGIILNITFESDNKFDRVELYRLHYTDSISSPVCHIVKNVKINSNVIKIIDDGVNLSEITFEQILSYDNYAFHAHTLEQKDNMLFLGNIREEYWDVEYDARSYGFPNGSTETFVLGNNGEKLTVNLSNIANVPKTHDCINIVNTVEYIDMPTHLIPDEHRLMYNPFGPPGSGDQLYGGYGTNVSFTFTLAVLAEDRYPDWYNVVGNDDPFNGGVMSPNASIYKVGFLNETKLRASRYRLPSRNNISNLPPLLDTYHPLESLDYGNSYIENLYCSYQRDAVYRFGLILVNSRGLRSQVKWIADIRMPSGAIEEFRIFDHNVTVNGGERVGVAYYPLGLEFYINNLPEGTHRVEIVRSPRRAFDKNILLQGIATLCYMSKKHSYQMKLAPFATMCGHIALVSEYNGVNENSDEDEVYSSKDLKYVYGINVFSPEIDYNKHYIDSYLTEEGHFDVICAAASLVYHRAKDSSSSNTSVLAIGSVLKEDIPISDNYNIASMCSVYNGSSVFRIHVYMPVTNTNNGSYLSRFYNSFTKIKNFHIPDNDFYFNKTRMKFIGSLYSDNYYNVGDPAKEVESYRYSKSYGVGSASFRNNSGDMGDSYLGKSYPSVYGIGMKIGYGGPVITLKFDDTDPANSSEDVLPIQYGRVLVAIWQLGSVGSLDATSYSMRFDDSQHVDFNRMPNLYKDAKLPVSIIALGASRSTCLIGNILKKTIPYGGLDYLSRGNSNYINVSNAINTNGGKYVSTTVFRGDTYIGVHTHAYTYAAYAQNAGIGSHGMPESFGSKIAFVCESAINVKLVSGSIPNQNSGEGYGEFQYNPFVSPITGYSQQEPMYAYSGAYSAQSNAIIQSNSDIYEVNELRTSRIQYSEVKNMDEYSDSFLLYKPANYIDLDTQYGKLTKLIEYNGKLLAIQERGVAQLTINERSLITDNIGKILLGTSDVLNRFDYVTTSFGVTDNYHNTVVVTPTMLSWYDPSVSEIIALTAGISSLSKSSNIQSKLTKIKNLVGDTLVSGYDYRLNRIHYVLPTSEGVFHISYSDYITKFDSTHTWIPNWILSTSTSNMITITADGKFWKHGEGNTTNYIYDKSGLDVHKSSITLAVKPENLSTAVYDAVSFINYGMTNQASISIECSTIGQSSSNVTTFVTESYYTLRENKLTLNIPRDVSESRLRGNYLTVKYTIIPNSNFKTFNIPYINTFYRQSHA
jgi:hypothetical protein